MMIFFFAFFKSSNVFDSGILLDFAILNGKKAIGSTIFNLDNSVCAHIFSFALIIIPEESCVFKEDSSLINKFK